jgi:hypothetical protein
VENPDLISFAVSDGLEVCGLKKVFEHFLELVFCFTFTAFLKQLSELVLVVLFEKIH